MGKKCRLLPFLVAAFILMQMTVDGAALGRTYEEKEWGLGMIVRGATIPFATAKNRLASLVPMMWYQGERVYFLGTEGGMMLYSDNKWRFSALGRIKGGSNFQTIYLQWHY